jgi:Domain of unknown function (DUF6249)
MHGEYWIGVAFWVFVGTVAVAGIVTDYKRRRLNIDLLRYSIEKGQPIDGELIDKLISQERLERGVKPDDLQMGGIITVGSGVGLCIFAVFIGQVAAWALYPIMGAGVLAICVGLGLIVAAKVLRASKERASKTSP